SLSMISWKNWNRSRRRNKIVAAVGRRSNMQERKNRETVPLNFGQKSEFKEIKVEPVDDLVAELEEISANAVAQLNAERTPEMMRGCTCPCEPCRRGRCDLHYASIRSFRDS